MRIGRLSKRVQLQSATEARDAHGQPVRTWVNQKTVWAAVEPIRGRELETARQLASEATIRVIVRYRADITTDWRVIYSGKTLEITEIINEDFDNRYLVMRCRQTT